MPTEFLSIEPKDIETPVLHGYLLGAVAPRPVAFASTIDREGNVNLSPFSFFNVFSANPPVMVFSPARRVRGNTTKHTLQNVYEVPEVVINIADFSMVQQMSLASTEYDKGVNEFVKSGLTQVKSDLIGPPRVLESPASFECKVTRVLPLGSEGGAGNLIMAEVVKLHIQKEVLDVKGKVDPFKLDAIARMGADYYCRANGDAIFEVPKPIRNKGVGVDQLPKDLKLSHVLTGNDLGMLGNIESLPNEEAINNMRNNEQIKFILHDEGLPQDRKVELIHGLAQGVLRMGDVEQALTMLLTIE